MHKYPTEILIVFFNPAVKPFYLRLLQETQYALLQLAAALARDDLHQLYFLAHRLLDHAVEFRIDHPSVAEDIM